MSLISGDRTGNRTAATSRATHCTPFSQYPSAWVVPRDLAHLPTWPVALEGRLFDTSSSSRTIFYPPPHTPSVNWLEMRGQCQLLLLSTCGKSNLEIYSLDSVEPWSIHHSNALLVMGVGMGGKVSVLAVIGPAIRPRKWIYTQHPPLVSETYKPSLWEADGGSTPWILASVWLLADFAIFRWTKYKYSVCFFPSMGANSPFTLNKPRLELGRSAWNVGSLTTIPRWAIVPGL